MEYKELFNRAKAAYGTGAYDDATLEFIFPELKESEDERIRKEIILLINACAKDGHFVTLEKHDSEEMLVWFEKQKEVSKAIEAVERIDKYIDEHLANAHDMKDSNPEKKYYRGWDDALSKMSGILQDVYSGEKQKEQQLVSCNGIGAAILSALASGIDTDEILKARGFTFEDVEKYLVSVEQKEHEPIDPCDASWDAYYRRGYERGLEVGRKEQKTTEKHDLVAQLKEHLANTPKEQLEAEWKELEKWDHVGPTVEEYPEGWSNEDEKMMGLVYGKRLPNNVVTTNAEWSESDTVMCNAALALLRSHPNLMASNGINKSSIIRWLQSFRPQRQGFIDDICSKAGISIPYLDGNQWCILKGDNIQSGVVGFGDTKEDALANFIKDVPIQQEWSEEDEKDVAHIIRVLDDCYAYGKHDLSKTDHENLVGTLKSLRPSWKPSEEQMDALKSKLPIIKGTGNNVDSILESLYEQLKKLI